MHVFIESKGWIEIVLKQRSWTTASRHSVVVHDRTSAPDQPVVGSHCVDYGGCPDHSSEAHA
jgi:hypothetical protein